MREKNRNSIESNSKLPQFTTMNVIDGQAGLVIYSSLIFYSLTIDNILNIIVLLILAGVTIATLTGDNGLLQKATDAKQANVESTALEKIKVEVAGSYGLDGKIDEEQLNNNLKRISGLKYNDVSLSNDTPIVLPAIVKLDNNNYEIKNDGTVTPIKPQAIGGLTKDNYGEYLDLGQSVVGTSSTTDDWRILYNDKDNLYGGTAGARVYAILADYLPNNNQAVADAGFKTNEVNDISGTYNVYSSTSRQNLLDRLNNTTAWQSLIPSTFTSKGIDVKGAIQAQILIASYNEKYNINPAKTLSTSTYFYIDNNTLKGIDTLYMPHPGSSPNNCSGYWTSSPCYGWPDYAWHVDNLGDVSDYGNYSTTTYGLCPVVSFPSNIQITKSTLNDKTIWSVIK